jgi:hypothetical protein
MKIYKKEISDGLEDALASNNTIAYCTLAEKYTPNEEQNTENLEKIIASNLNEANQDQLDLFYLKSILVSTGWNKNDDVFDSQELWNARNTPEDKPFNFMHDEKDIIGHITGNIVIDHDGNEIENTESLPDQFNILTTSVIYTAWSDKEQRERMEQIVAEIEEGRWFVSMECLFPDFDYAVIDDSGKASVVKRNEDSAFLTKHLRSYGGTGKYQNYQVGRLLRNLSFSGKGLVSKPANPRSVILEGNKFFNESKAFALEIQTLKENDMSDELNQQIIDLQTQLAEAKAANEALKSELATSKVADYEEEIKALEASVASKDAEIAEAKELSVKEAEAKEHSEEEMKKMKEEMAAMKEELAMYKKKEAMMKRQAQLEEAGLEAEAAASTAEDFAEADEETFDRVLAAVKKSVGSRAKEEAVAEKETAEEEISDEVDTAEASDKDLDTVEEPTELLIAEAGVEDEEGSLRAVASEWLGSVLRSTPKTN